jgi:hypothetical protein
MIGYDKKLQPHLYNTTTPIRHNVAIHNHIPAINLQVNPNSIRKISRVPFTSQYINFPNNNILQNNLLIPAAPPPPPRQQPPPPPPPQQVPIRIPQQNENTAAINIQAAIRRQQSNIKLAGQEALENAYGLLVRQDVPQISIYGNNPIFAEERAKKTLQAVIKRKIQQQQPLPQPQRPPVPIRPQPIPIPPPLPLARAPPTLDVINELLNPLEANLIIGDAIKNKLARNQLKQLKQEAQDKKVNSAALTIQQAYRTSLAQNERAKRLVDTNASIIQNAYRNKLARNQLKQLKQEAQDLQLVSRKEINKQRFKQVLDVLKKQKKEQIFNKLKEKAQFTVFAREIIKSKIKTKNIAEQMRKDIIKVEAIRQKKQADAITQMIIKDYEDNTNASIIQNAYKNFKKKQIDKVMAFDFPLATPDIPIQTENYNPSPVLPANPLILSQKPLDMSKIPITVMPNVKPIQRAFRKYKEAKNKKQEQEQQEQDKKKGLSATKIQKVIKGSITRRDVKSNRLFNEYKQKLKEINTDEVIEIAKIEDKIDYEKQVINKNKGGLFDMFNTKEKERKKEIVDKAKNTIEIQENKKKALKDKLEQKRKKAQELLQKQLIVIKNDNNVDVDKIKGEYADKLKKIYKEFQQRKEDKKQKLIEKEEKLKKARLEAKAKRDADIAKGEELLKKRKEAYNTKLQQEKEAEKVEQQEKLQKEAREEIRKIEEEQKKIKELKQKEASEKNRLKQLEENARKKAEQRKRLEEEEVAKEAYNARKKEEEKQRKAEEQRKKKEAEDLVKQEQEEIQRILEQKRQLGEKNEYAKMAADINIIIAELEKINTTFDNASRNNLTQKESLLKKYEKNVKEYYDYKSSIPKNAFINVYKALGKGIDEKFLLALEKEFDRNIKKFKKDIDEVSLEKQKQEEIKNKRKELMENVKSKINDLEEEISPLYLTEFSSNKDTMRIVQRQRLYVKISKLYNSYLFEKKKISQNEYYSIEQPEWEMFKRIKDEYLDTELKEIEKMETKKTIPEYKTKEEVEALSKTELREILTAFNVLTDEGLIYSNVPPTTTTGRKDIRWAYNVYNRKYS